MVLAAVQAERQPGVREREKGREKEIQTCALTPTIPPSLVQFQPLQCQGEGAMIIRTSSIHLSSPSDATLRAGAWGMRLNHTCVHHGAPQTSPWTLPFGTMTRMQQHGHWCLGGMTGEAYPKHAELHCLQESRPKKIVTPLTH
mmetsp:Transcript_56998/g.101775  ORF Transcript_56998/g.101775 Transcript_56998/m.101775 type:complete len:143 (+) Transcript_56998:554-982(+)